MLAQNSEALQEAAANLYIANSDEIVRQQCRAREDAELRERTLERNNRLLKEEVAKHKKALLEKDSALAEMGNTLTEKDNALAEKEQEILRLKALLAK